MLCSVANSARRGDLTARSSVYLKSDAMSNMTSIEIDEPLLKNGRDIDACWLDDAVKSNLKLMKRDAKQKRLMKSRVSSANRKM